MSTVSSGLKKPLDSASAYPLNESQNVIINRNQRLKRSHSEEEEKNVVYVRKGSTSNKRPDLRNFEEDDENVEIEIPLLKKQKGQPIDPVKKDTNVECDVGLIRDRLNKSSGYVPDPSYPISSCS